MRSADMRAIAPHYARLVPGLLSLECWGGATFDVAMRFLKEDPWQRLAELRAAVPNIPLQMLLRASNAVGYTNYADNVVQHFIAQAADTGIDIFRIFDCFNNVDSMRLAIDAVRDSGAVAETAICYTADLFDETRPKYNLDYYVGLARQLEDAGAHILAIKDMAGVCKPRAAHALVTALREAVDLPIHFHTHDTSGIAAASVLAAVDAGCDAVDGALDALSGLTSQPNLGSIAAALRGGERDPEIDEDAMRALSDYWEDVRKTYAPFESAVKSGTADVYRHEMPGGQYSNLREQARAMGIAHRWDEVSRAYAAVNRLFGDIVKVTPSSKVVGDLALYMVTNELSEADVADPDRPIDFPASVVSLMRGELGFPADGFPPELQAKVLRGEPPMQGRPGAQIEPADLEAARSTVGELIGQTPAERDVASWLLYPKVFTDFAAHRALYGDVGNLPTEVFFYGLAPQQEMAVDIDVGKTLVIRLLGRSDDDAAGVARLFFELNGQPRRVRIAKAGSQAAAAGAKAEPDNPSHVGAPMPGMVVRVAVQAGDHVEQGDTLLVLEAMKMETVVSAPVAGTVNTVHVAAGKTVAAQDLLVEFAPG